MDRERVPVLLSLHLLELGAWPESDRFQDRNPAVLCPLMSWSQAFLPADNGSFNVKMAASALMAQCYSIGTYNPMRRRRRGGFDEGRVVINNGRHLVINGGVCITGTTRDSSFTRLA